MVITNLYVVSKYKYFILKRKRQGIDCPKSTQIQLVGLLSFMGMEVLWLLVFMKVVACWEFVGDGYHILTLKRL